MKWFAQAGGRAADKNELARALLLPRHALHATRLSLAGFGDWQCDLPPDLRAWL